MRVTDVPVSLETALASRYALERELGRGGMATVYLAEDHTLHRRVALKVLHPEVATPLGPERFQREIAIAARLNHPHILPLYDSGEADGRLCYAMPYVAGESLRQRLRREPQLPVAEAVRIVAAVASALDYAHQAGVIHRDIKPENILLARDPGGGPAHVWVADFGLARALDVAGGERLTETGLVLGTPAYMSPEQGSAEGRVDARSDLYALGCVAYELLAGVPPFTGPTAQAILARHAVDPVPALRTVRPGVPEPVERAIERALAKVPADRFATATEFARALTAEGVPPLASTRSPWRRQARSLRGLTVSAALLVTAAVGALLPRSRSAPAIASAARIAVLPFRPLTADTALTRLGNDLAATIGASLEGVGGIETADRLSIATALGQQSILSAVDANALARHLGASSVLQGTLVRAGENVRLDCALYATEGRAPLAEGITVTAHRDSVAAMTDSIVWALLRHVWRRGVPPSPSVAAVTTRSLSALRAFLDGEHAVEQNRWDDGALAYRSAIAADSTFWLAYFRFALTQFWLEQPVEPQVLEVVRQHRHSLSEQEALLAEAFLTSTDSMSQMLKRYEEVARRFPDYWPGWFLLGDLLYHNGPILGHDRTETLQAFRRAVALNPNLVPAWQHLHNLVVGRDEQEAQRDLDHLTGLGWLSKQPPGLQIAMQLVTEVGRTGGVLTPNLYAVVDSQIALAVKLQSIEATPGFLQGPQLGLLWLGFPRAQLEYNRRAVRLAGQGPDFVAAARAADAWAWAARGRWDTALVVLNRVALAHPGPIVGRRPQLAVENYGLAVLGAWLGVTQQAIADQRRPAAIGASEGLAEDEDRREALGRVAWLDGVLAFVKGDRVAIARARVAAMRSRSAHSERIVRSLAAFSQALAGDRVGAGLALADLEESCAERVGCDTFTPSIAVQRMAAAEWLREGGNRERASRLLRWQDAMSGPQWLLTTDYALAGPAYLARARLEEAGGDPRRAREYYQQFLRWYDLPMASQVHLVDEAKAALVRLEEASP